MNYEVPIISLFCLDSSNTHLARMRLDDDEPRAGVTSSGSGVAAFFPTPTALFIIPIRLTAETGVRILQYMWCQWEEEEIWRWGKHIFFSSAEGQVSC